MRRAAGLTATGILAAAPLLLLSGAPAVAATPLAVAISSPAVAEGNFGFTGGAAITLTLSAASTSPVRVNYAPDPNLTATESSYASTATFGSEWSLAPGSVTFNPGERSKTVNVQVTGDNAAESDEYAAVSFTSPDATIQAYAGGIAYVMIKDDDAPRVHLTGVSQNEGTSKTATPFWLQAQLDKPAPLPVTFTISQCCGTTQTDDVLPVGGTVTIPAGRTAFSFPVYVKADNVREAAEDFYISGDSLHNANPVVTGSSATWDRTLWSHDTILNDD